MLNIIFLLAKVFILCFIIVIIMITSLKAKVQNHLKISNFQVKSIGIGIGNTGPVITWYLINTKIRCIALLYLPHYQHRYTPSPDIPLES